MMHILSWLATLGVLSATSGVETNPDGITRQRRNLQEVPAFPCVGEEQTSLGAKNWAGIVSSSDGTHLYAYLKESYPALYTSRDSGKTWTVNSQIYAKINGIATSADGTKVAVCTSGSAGIGPFSLSISSDAGVAWTWPTFNAMNAMTGPCVVASSADGTILAVGGAGMLTSFSTDSGLTWTTPTNLNPSGIRAIASSSDGRRLVVVPGVGYISTSKDLGASWTEHIGSGYRYWVAVASNAAGTILAAVDNSNYQRGFICTSIDSGVTWTERMSDQSRPWTAIASSADGMILAAATSYDHIYSSNDAGATWVQQSDGYLYAAGCGKGCYTSGDVCGGCALGYYSLISGASACMQVPAGFYGGVPIFAPKPCPPGTSTSAGSVSLSACLTIPPGSYTTDGAVNQCPASSEVSYDARSQRQKCTPCPFPQRSNCRELENIRYWSHRDETGLLIYYPDGQFSVCKRCSIVGIGLSTTSLVAVLVLLASTFVASLALFIARDVRRNLLTTVGLMVYILVPFVDNLSDLAFILTGDFFNVALLVAMSACYMLPNLFFIQSLINRGAAPKFWILPMPQRLFFSAYDSFFKVLFTSVVMIPFLIVNAPVMAPWFVLGSYLFVSKAFAFRIVGDVWLFAWTGIGAGGPNPAASHASGAGLQLASLGNAGLKDDATAEQSESNRSAKLDIDGSALNDSLFYHAVFETFPVLIIQIVNGVLLKNFTPLGIFSITFSTLNAFNALYRILYYRVFKGLSMSDIPVDLSIVGGVWDWDINATVDGGKSKLPVKLEEEEEEEEEEEAGRRPSWDVFQRHVEGLALLRRDVDGIRRDVDALKAKAPPPPASPSQGLLFGLLP